MSTTRLSITALALILGLMPAPSSTESHVTVSGATAAETLMVEWALNRFELADLELPPLRIEFRADPDACFGYAGTHNHRLGRILICNRGQFRPEPHQTLLHELAHAWASTNLTDADRSAWTARRGLSTWSAPDTPWWTMGNEQAAEIVSWGLLDDETRLVWILIEDCDQLRSDFTALTGVAPLNESDASCKADGTGNRRSPSPVATKGTAHSH